MTSKKHINKYERDEIPRSLPSIVDQLQIGFVFRFITTSAFGGAFNVTPSNLLDCWFVAGTATTAYQLFDFVRVKKVVVRALAAAAAPTAVSYTPLCTVGVEYVGLSSGSFGGGRQASNSSMSYDVPAIVSLGPDPASQAAQFQPSGGSSIFAVRAIDGAGAAVVGACIDVHVVLKNSGDVNPSAVGVARSGLTPGNLYYGGLDGQVLASTQARSAFIPRA